MKIMCVSHESSLTGAPKAIFQLAKFLATKHEVIFVTKLDGPLFKEIKRENIPNLTCINTNTSYYVSRLPFKQRVQSACELIEETKPDLVYVNTTHAAEWVVASRLCGVKNIFHIHEMKNVLAAAVRVGYLTLDAMDYVDLVICASNDVKRDVDDFFPIKPHRSIVMDYFFDCNRILDLSKIEQPLPRNALGATIDLDKPIACSCGVADYRKGVDIFFEAARQVPNAQFLWIGQWNSRSGLENPAGEAFAREKLDNFFITDEVLNPYFYLNLADLFVLTSREDPNPLVVFESLILGKQAICFSETGGSRFLLDRYGYVMTGQPEANTLSSLIKRLFPTDSPAFRPAWLQSMQTAVIEQYDSKVVIKQFEELIQNLYNGQEQLNCV